MSYLLIHYDCALPAFEEVDLPSDPHEWLHACYDLLGVDSIEVCPTLIRDLVLVIDECGKLYDGWESRVNAIASDLYGSVSDPIVGDVIVARRSGTFGENLLDLNRQDISRIKGYFYS